MTNKQTRSIHEMRLQKKPFEQIRSGGKIYELRLYDEKRQKISPGDIIVFSLSDDPSKQLSVAVADLLLYKDFAELYENIPKTDLGYMAEEQADPADMSVYYSAEDIKKYGVVAIKIRLI